MLQYTKVEFKLFGRWKNFIRIRKAEVFLILLMIPIFLKCETNSVLKVKVLSPSLAKIEWAKIEDSEGYLVFRSEKEVSDLPGYKTEYFDVITDTDREICWSVFSYKLNEKYLIGKRCEKIPEGKANGTPPSAPSHLTATFDDSITAVYLSWDDPSDNEMGFKIERCEGISSYCDMKEWIEIDEVKENERGYVDSRIKRGRKYCYRVTSYNKKGKSPASKAVCLGIPPHPDSSFKYISAETIEDEVVKLDPSTCSYSYTEMPDYVTKRACVINIYSHFNVIKEESFFAESISHVCLTYFPQSAWCGSLTSRMYPDGLTVKAKYGIVKDESEWKKLCPEISPRNFGINFEKEFLLIVEWDYEHGCPFFADYSLRIFPVEIMVKEEEKHLIIRGVAAVGLNLVMVEACGTDNREEIIGGFILPKEFMDYNFFSTPENLSCDEEN